MCLHPALMRMYASGVAGSILPRCVDISVTSLELKESTPCGTVDGATVPVDRAALLFVTVA